MLYPTVSEQETSEVLLKYGKLNKTIKNNVTNLYFSEISISL